MLNKTSQTNTDMQWQKSAAPVKPPAATAAMAGKPAPPDVTRFIESATVAGGLLYTEALRQAQEDRPADSTGMAQQAPHARSLADLPYLISPEYAAYRKRAADTAHPAPGKSAGDSKAQQQAKPSAPIDSTGVWAAVIFVALTVAVVMWVF